MTAATTATTAATTAMAVVTIPSASTRLSFYNRRIRGTGAISALRSPFT